MTMPVDRATAALVERLRLPQEPGAFRGPLADLRKGFGYLPGIDRDSQVASLEHVTLGPEAVPTTVIVPEGEVHGLVVYFHGGGWVLGAARQFTGFGRALAADSGWAVALVDYRLAPEHPYPAAADDAYAAVVALSDAQRPEAVSRGAPIVVAGDSAGGNLAAVVALRSRDSGGPRIDLQVLLYPIVDAETDSPSYVDPDCQVFLTRDSMLWFWERYAPDESVRAEPGASPLRASSLAGLPPALVVAAGADPLRDQGKRYADALAEAGIPVEYRLFADQMHGFVNLPVPSSEAGLAAIVAALGRIVAPSAH